MHPSTQRPVVATLTTIYATLSQIEAGSFTVGDADPAIDALGQLLMLASEREATEATLADGLDHLRDSLWSLTAAADAVECRDHTRYDVCAALWHAVGAGVNACRATDAAKRPAFIGFAAASVAEALYAASLAA